MGLSSAIAGNGLFGRPLCVRHSRRAWRATGACQGPVSAGGLARW